MDWIPFGDMMSRLLLIGAALLVSVTAIAQQPQPGQADAEALRRSTAEGVAICKANLASAPPELKLSEAEDFCACMGINEFVMAKGAMSDADKAVIRPRQQQTCLASIRKDPAPAQAIAPTQPLPAPVPPAAASAPVETQSATPPPPAPVRKVDAWALTTNRSGAPIAYVRPTPAKAAPSAGGADYPLQVEAFLMYCRARDALGFRVLFKPGSRENSIAMTLSGGDTSSVELDRFGVATPQGWAFLVKSWEEGEKHTPAEVRKSSNYNPNTDFGFIRGKGSNAAYHIGGYVILEGLGNARVRLREQCASSIASGVAAGNFDTGGIEGFADEIVPASVTGGSSLGAASMAPRSKPPAPVLGEAECRALLQRTGTAVLPRMQALAAALNNVSSIPQLCQAARKTIAFHSDIKNIIAVCSSHGFVRQTIGNSNAAIANARSQMRQAGC